MALLGGTMSFYDTGVPYTACCSPGLLQLSHQLSRRRRRRLAHGNHYIHRRRRQQRSGAHHRHPCHEDRLYLRSHVLCRQHHDRPARQRNPRCSYIPLTAPHLRQLAAYNDGSDVL